MLRVIRAGRPRVRAVWEREFLKNLETLESVCGPRVIDVIADFVRLKGIILDGAHD